MGQSNAARKVSHIPMMNLRRTAQDDDVVGPIKPYGRAPAMRSDLGVFDGPPCPAHGRTRVVKTLEGTGWRCCGQPVVPPLRLA